VYNLHTNGIEPKGEPALQLQHVLDNVYYLPGASNIGLVIGAGQQALLIDTGVGERSGRQLLQLLDQRGLHLAAILNTHGHGDHAGGNAYLAEHTGARVYAPLHDGIVLRYPVWGTLCTFGGAEPIAELSVPRFAPHSCAVDVTVTEGELEIAGVTVQVVPLPGHTGTHTGYIVDNVFFIGDILAGEAELANAPISYAYSITKRLASLEKLRHYSCACYVLGHGPVERDITQLIERNIAQLNDVLSFIKAYLARGGAEANELLLAVCTKYGITIRNVREYYMLYPTLHSFLSHLNNCGEITHSVENNRLLWHTVERGC
jgi:glyoxylase-like metal-dependent hydrolase (beta-lactamase superfamily II)